MLSILINEPRINTHANAARTIQYLFVQISLGNFHSTFTVGQRMTRTYVRQSSSCTLHKRHNALRNALRLVCEVQSPQMSEWNRNSGNEENQLDNCSQACDQLQMYARSVHAISQI